MFVFFFYFVILEESSLIIFFWFLPSLGYVLPSSHTMLISLNSREMNRNDMIAMIDARLS